MSEKANLAKMTDSERGRYDKAIKKKGMSVSDIAGITGLALEQVAGVK